MSNPYRVIKLLAFVTGLCIVSCTTALAQQSLFVYLQTENLQPFYVQMGDKVYSSSAIGHLIISGLPDNTCNFEIGFPQHATQPQRFSFPLRNKDHGYQLIKNGSRGWALLDLQTEETIKPLKEAGNSSLLYGERKKDDAFATLMAAVVNDSAVLYTSIVKKEDAIVPDVATHTNEKPAEKQPVVRAEEKPVQVDTAVAILQPSIDTASVVKTETIARDTAVVTKYDPKEKGLNEKLEKKEGVVKIQQQTKDGETKMVFVDSSESPVSVVTVYISEEKKTPEDKPVTPIQAPAQPPVETPATNVAKTETKQEPVVKDSVKTVVAPPPAKKEVVETPTAPTLTKEEIADQIKKETWRSGSEKKTSVTDTVVIILESRQMKKGVTAAEEPKPLFRPKTETPPAPAKQVTADTTVIQIATPAKQDLEEMPKAVFAKPEEKEVVKQEPIKPATEEKQVVTAEPVKPTTTDTAAKKGNEPVTAKTEKEEPVKQPAPKTEETKPIVDSEKKTVPEPVQKDTATAVMKTGNQPAVVTTKPAEPEKPKTVEPEKKAEVPNKLVMINSDCVKLATDVDVDKLRVKMLPENDLQKKLAIANKYFKTMCLYAKQIKALSELFPTDEAKYKFLEMAYPFAADTANFKQLYELLTDESYVTKFKKLVRIQ